MSREDGENSTYDPSSPSSLSPLPYTISNLGQIIHPLLPCLVEQIRAIAFRAVVRSRPMAHESFTDRALYQDRMSPDIPDDRWKLWATLAEETRESAYRVFKGSQCCFISWIIQCEDYSMARIREMLGWNLYLKFKCNVYNVHFP